MYDVAAIGELLIDFIECGTSAQGNRLFEANPGGAPCNALAMLEKLGHKTAFIGKVGDDSFGRMLGKTIAECGIDPAGLVYDRDVPTTLAFVHKLADGDRDFSFYRSPGADLMLREDEIPENILHNCRILHFGSLSMTGEPANSAVRSAIRRAKEAGALISFDPNLRPPLWNSLADAADAIWYGIRQCDILKIADNEIKWLTGEEDYGRGIEVILENAPVTLITVTLGNKGSLAYYGNQTCFAEPFLNAEPVDTTGAGDTFCGSVLGYVLEHGLDSLSWENLHEMLQNANAAASLITMRKGGIRSMPEKSEVEARIEKRHSR